MKLLYFKRIWASLFFLLIMLMILGTTIVYANDDKCVLKNTEIEKENIVSKKPVLPKVEMMPIDQEFVKDITTNVLEEESAASQIEQSATPTQDDQKLYELVDLWNFKPSYNMVVTQALVRAGEPKDRFVDWYEELLGTEYESNNWSLPFLLWCVDQSNAQGAIPMIHDLNEMIEFFKMNEQYYHPLATSPKVGDLILLDDDGDQIADRINIISDYFYKTATIKTVGGYVWSNAIDSYIVQEEDCYFGHKNIVGICRPNYGPIRDTTFSSPEIVFNGVDTVCYLSKPEYAEVLAQNGIEVIARYINTEGRKPLDIEEAQRYSDVGIRIMMIYQINTNDPYKGYETGYLFGSRALEYARNLQAPKGTPIFFCCDCACDFRAFDKVAQFILGVKDAMQDEYGVGLYGGYYVNEAMYNLGLIDAHWQSLGFNDGYLSPNLDMFQSSGTTYFFDEIPLPFDSNYVKNPEKVSYIMPKSTEN